LRASGNSPILAENIEKGIVDAAWMASGFDVVDNLAITG
jgi:hypothetical protein